MFPNTAPRFTFIYVCNNILFSASHSLFYLQKSFLQTVARFIHLQRSFLQAVTDLFMYKDPFYRQQRICLCTKILSTNVHKVFLSVFSFSFSSDSTRGCRAKVWYRTRNTPARLGFAPEDSQPCEPWCRCSCLFPPG